MGCKMITPSFSLTATERVLPRLALDFTTSTLDPRVTFTRTGNTATVINSSGLVALINADLPRFDFDPTTLVCKGLLIEEARTNLCLYSSNLSQSPTWSGGRGGAASFPVVTANYAVAPDGTTTATRIQLSLGGGTTTSDFTWQVQILTGTSCFGSFWIKTADNSTKTIHLRSATSTSITVTGTWTRYSWNVGTLLGNQFGVGLRGGQTPTNSDTADLLVWGAQLETGAFPTSYIPTELLAVTRNADVATMTGTNFSDWYNATEGGAVVQVLPSTISGTRPAVEFDDNTANESITLRGVAADPQLFVVDGGATQATLDAGTITANTLYKLGGAWKASSFAVAVNGAAAVTQASGTFPTATQARLGSDGTNYLNGHLQSLRFWPQRLTNAEVQAFSK
jgi:hypothetical protein